MAGGRGHLGRHHCARSVDVWTVRYHCIERLTAAQCRRSIHRTARVVCFSRELRRSHRSRLHRNRRRCSDPKLADKRKRHCPALGVTYPRRVFRVGYRQQLDAPDLCRRCTTDCSDQRIDGRRHQHRHCLTHGRNATAVVACGDCNDRGMAELWRQPDTVRRRATRTRYRAYQCLLLRRTFLRRHPRHRRIHRAGDDRDSGRRCAHGCWRVVACDRAS